MAKWSIKAGSTSQSDDIFIQDSSSAIGAGLTGLVFNSGSLTCYYTFLGANATATSVTLATLAAVNSAFSSGGFKEIDATNMPGHYRFDIPNAALAAGNGHGVVVHFKGATNMAPLAVAYELTGWDNQDAVHGGLSSLPNTAVTTNGSLLTSGTGTDQLHVSSGHVANVDTLTTYTGNTVQTGDSFARLGAPAGASVSADVAAVKSDTGTTLTDAVAIKAQTDKMAFTVTNQIDANVLSVNGSATAAANVSKANQAIMRGTCSGGTVTTAVCSSITTPASLTDAGQLIGRTILFDSNTTTANLQGQASNITASTTGATPTLTFTAMTHAPANGDTFSVV